MKKAYPSEELVSSKIHFIRGEKVMLDADLAALYDVETKNLKRQVRRNSSRFPEDFMFILTKEEYQNLRRQIGTSSFHGGTRYLPMAFTEQGVAMLSSVLSSERAIQVNVQIIRIFTRMRKMLLEYKELLRKTEKLEGKVSHHDENIRQIFNYLKKLIQQENKPRTRIGYKK